MIINKNSFHYKVVSSVTDIEWDLERKRKFTLCKYFWMFVFSLIFYPLIKLKRWLEEKIDNIPEEWNEKLKIVGAVLLIVFFYGFMTWASIVAILDKEDPILGIIMGSIILFCLYIFVPGFLLWLKYENSETAKLITSYIKSRKQKICPILEFKKQKTKKRKINKKRLCAWTLIILGYVGLFLEITEIIKTTTFSSIFIISLFIVSLILIIINVKGDNQ